MAVRALPPILAVILLTPSPTEAGPQFLVSPFQDSSVSIQQGPLYADDGTRHFGAGFAIDYILGITDNSSTWITFDVVAAGGGVAIRSFQEGYGNFVLIRHDVTDDQGRAFYTLYGHLADSSISSAIPFRSRYDTDFAQWKRVEAGHFIGRAGSTGKVLCTGSSCIHLHFEVFRGGYFENAVDPYDISTEDHLFTRARYPGFPDFAGCGAGVVWTHCPPAVAAAMPAPLPESAQFEFRLASLLVDGNVQGVLADGNPGFLDNFNDGSLTAFPTSEIFCFGTVSESGGSLNLRSADGANTLTPGFLVDNCNLGLRTGSLYRLQEGGGNSVATASFRADVPLLGQAYGLQMLTLDRSELVNIQFGHHSDMPRITALARSPSLGQITRSVTVNLDGVQRIIFRLFFNDATNQVVPSFSIDGGNTFQEIVLPQPGIVMTTGSQGIVSVFGSVAIP